MYKSANAFHRMNNKMKKKLNGGILQRHLKVSQRVMHREMCNKSSVKVCVCVCGVDQEKYKKYIRIYACNDTHCVYV